MRETSLDDDVPVQQFPAVAVAAATAATVTAAAAAAAPSASPKAERATSQLETPTRTARSTSFSAATSEPLTNLAAVTAVTATASAPMATPLAASTNNVSAASTQNLAPAASSASVVSSGSSEAIVSPSISRAQSREILDDGSHSPSRERKDSFAVRLRKSIGRGSVGSKEGVPAGDHSKALSGSNTALNETGTPVAAFDTPVSPGTTTVKAHQPVSHSQSMAAPVAAKESTTSSIRRWASTRLGGGEKPAAVNANLASTKEESPSQSGSTQNVSAVGLSSPSTPTSPPAEYGPIKRSAVDPIKLAQDAKAVRILRNEQLRVRQKQQRAAQAAYSDMVEEQAEATEALKNAQRKETEILIKRNQAELDTHFKVFEKDFEKKKSQQDVELKAFRKKAESDNHNEWKLFKDHQRNDEKSFSHDTKKKVNEIKDKTERAAAKLRAEQEWKEQVDSADQYKTAELTTKLTAAIHNFMMQQNSVLKVFEEGYLIKLHKLKNDQLQADATLWDKQEREKQTLLEAQMQALFDLQKDQFRARNEKELERHAAMCTKRESELVKIQANERKNLPKPKESKLKPKESKRLTETLFGTAGRSSKARASLRDSALGDGSSNPSPAGTPTKESPQPMSPAHSLAASNSFMLNSPGSRNGSQRNTTEVERLLIELEMDPSPEAIAFVTELKDFNSYLEKTSAKLRLLHQQELEELQLVQREQQVELLTTGNDKITEKKRQHALILEKLQEAFQAKHRAFVQACLDEREALSLKYAQTNLKDLPGPDTAL
ncbi:hypothetical protein CAOG_009810 [Capsaspora owczarzaki ATCC 30864]|uniref:Uncharacterized protein n=1 Tax=Capsaspora owczarzaki (strain ATCC 30864) TaxID=595528 RepID=A0A0D2X3H9_CAPO3|nr:hypothetical protein CAOG_009810 [Capsaspora owczarzaki ATCC 30864]